MLSYRISRGTPPKYSKACSWQASRVSNFSLLTNSTKLVRDQLSVATKPRADACRVEIRSSHIASADRRGSQTGSMALQDERHASPGRTNTRATFPLHSPVV